MSQNPTVLPTTGTVSGLQMTQKTNDALDTLNTHWSGASAPATPEQYQFWEDTSTTPATLRQYDGSQWVFLWTLDSSNHRMSLGAATASAINENAPSGNWNRIINGDMRIDQANEGASLTLASNSPVYTVDQWIARYISAGAGSVTAQRVADAPVGFTHSLKATVGTGAGSVGATDLLYLQQPVEGLNVYDFGYGAAGATPTSVSFWVKSSVTGTFAAVLGNGSRAAVNTFTISAANTWEKKTINNIPGDTTGTWPTDTSAGLTLYIVAAAGSTYQTATLNTWQAGFFLASTSQTNTLLTTSGATFQLTGVKLEPGVQATPFERLLYTTAFNQCRRYYCKTFPSGTAPAQNAGTAGALFNSAAASGFGSSYEFGVPMRAAPTITTFNPSASNANWRDVTAAADRTATVGTTSPDRCNISGSGSAAGNANLIHFTANARL
ncbi:MAG: hypothetical protein K8U57_07485 [Planctomycetes bacterium]|nr:hypothetical protein [Planctomycetota bacterium]